MKQNCKRLSGLIQISLAFSISRVSRRVSKSVTLHHLKSNFRMKGMSQPELRKQGKPDVYVVCIANLPRRCKSTLQNVVDRSLTAHQTIFSPNGGIHQTPLSLRQGDRQTSEKWVSLGRLKNSPGTSDCFGWRIGL